MAQFWQFNLCNPEKFKESSALKSLAKLKSCENHQNLWVWNWSSLTDVFWSSFQALYGYAPQNDDELELQEGDLVSVMEKCDDGWFVGKSRWYRGSSALAARRSSRQVSVERQEVYHVTFNVTQLIYYFSPVRFKSYSCRSSHGKVFVRKLSLIWTVTSDALEII